MARRRNEPRVHRYVPDPDTPGVCAACHLIEDHRGHGDPPATDPDTAAVEARRLGERTER